MKTVYIGNTLINDVFLGSKRMDDVAQYDIYTPTDQDAINFLNATGIQNTIIERAINTLVVDLKQYDVWDKLYSMYPLVGGSSAACQYNLVNTSSLNLGFSGSWNFNDNGVSGSGTNNYAGTGFRPLTASYANVGTNLSLGVYVQTNITGGYDMGMDAVSDKDLYLISRYTNNLSYFYYTSSLTVANTDAKGFWIGTVSGSGANNQVIYKNGVSIASKTGAGGNIDDIFGGGYLVLGAASNAPVESSRRLYGLSFIGKGLTSTNASNLNTAVQSFATSLGRNV
jgi:hypothetical protein